MRNYASRKTHRGRVAYRTPDRFIFQHFLKTSRKKQRQSLKFR